MSRFFSLVILLLFTQLCFAADKSKCTLNIKDLPKIRGLYLGMSENEFKNQFIKAYNDTDESMAKIGVTSYFEPELVIVDDLDFITAQFIDGKLYFFSLEYEECDPQSVSEMITKVSKEYGLPLKGWKLPNPKDYPKSYEKIAQEIQCTDFKFHVSTGGNRFFPALIVTNTKAESILQQRQKASEVSNEITRRNNKVANPEKADFKINRFYQSSEDFYRIVISTNKTRKIKCVVYDNRGEPVTANTFIITPPVDEVIISTIGVSKSVKSVKCFPD